MTKKSQPKPQSNAERQAAYRARRAETGEGSRLTTMVHPAVTAGLKRLSRHYQITQAEMLLRVVQDAENDVVQGMKSADEKKYYS